MINLKNTIEDMFNVLLPISGGCGQSFDDAIIINGGVKDGVSIEYMTLKYLLILIGKNIGEDWNLEEQQLTQKDNKYYDILSIVFNNEPNVFHNYYFDITEFYGK